MQEQNTVGQRFTQLIAHLGISKNAFATSLDKTATVIQHLVEERNKPGFDLLCKVFEVYPNVSKDWLLQGTGPMLTSVEELTAQQKLPAQPERIAVEIPAAPIVAAEAATPVAATSAPATSAAVTTVVAPVVATSAPAEPVAAPAPEPLSTAGREPIVPVPAVAAAAIAAPSVPDAGAWQTALYTQQMAHQLALAELRNQHLQDQQRLMQQMMDLLQRKLL